MMQMNGHWKIDEFAQPVKRGFTGRNVHKQVLINQVHRADVKLNTGVLEFSSGVTGQARSISGYKKGRLPCLAVFSEAAP